MSCHRGLFAAGSGCDRFQPFSELLAELLVAVYAPFFSLKRDNFQMGMLKNCLVAHTFLHLLQGGPNYGHYKPAFLDHIFERSVERKRYQDILSKFTVFTTKVGAD